MRWTLIVALFSLSVTHVAEAQRRTGAGVRPAAGIRGGRDFENKAWSLGAQLRLGLRDRVVLLPSADIFRADDGTGWQGNLDAAYLIGPGRTIYAGGGAAVTDFSYADEHDDGGSEWGYNLFFGLIAAQAGSRSFPYAEFRWTQHEGTSPFRIVVGYSRRLGGR